MTPDEKRLHLQKTLAGYLFAAALLPCAHAAPNCIVKLPDGSTQAWQPVHDEKLGYCVLWEVFDPARDGVIQRITYDSGKVRNVSAGEAVGALRFDTEQGGDFFQMGGAWPSNEYTRHLPDPGVAQEKAFGISVGVKKGRPDDWDLVAIWFKHDEDVFRQLTGYPGKLKRMGFANVIRDHELDNNTVRDEKSPSDALMAFSYAATNSAGYRAEVICGRPLRSAPDGSKKPEAPPLAAAIMAMPRLLPCTIALSSPTRAGEKAKGEANRKAREEKARKDRENRRKISDDFFDHVDKMPD
ncbi:MAG: hypothetical protein LBD67_03540 [Candidatus Accumulibacter sp.]|jgi:hypothetical protein|nr:hypothetical protein [Accumulibacter sp.]